MLTKNVRPHCPTYGEFPFKLEYELTGKKYTVEDVWVCEFNGFGSNEGFGKHRQWKGKVKSTGEDKIVLLEVDEPIELDWQGIPMTQTIYYLPGPARYYMGDMIGVAGTFSHYFPEAFCFEYFFPFSTSDSRLSAEELYKKFGIKLINWEYTPPIKNTFK